MGVRVLTGLLRKEFAQFFRDRIMMFVVLWLYTVEIVMCPLALTFDVRHSPLAVVDHDRTPASRALLRAYTATEAFDFVAALARDADAEAWLDRGDAGLVLIVPPGFQRALVRGEPARYQALIDGSNSNVAANVKAYVHGINARYLRGLAGGPPRPAAGLEPVTRVWYNPPLSSNMFMALSMIALAGMMVGTALPAASLVREKEQGTIEQLLVTPIRAWQLFLAKTLPPLCTCLLAIFPGVLLMAWLFDVPMRGSFGFFLLESAVFLLSAIALGVFIGVYVQTLQQALLLSFFGLFPILFLSGTVTPIESMPPFLQTLSLLSPLRYYMDILLGVFLKGAGWRELWPETLALAALAVGLYAGALAAFRRRYR
ncbi:MAG: ABC transporter permease [Gammaproteobacteria bacterium]|nr:ABC transporter permease [Gammaproteobacteria bacterium]